MQKKKELEIPLVAEEIKNTKKHKGNVHKKLKGIAILNGDVMDAPVQNGIADLDKWLSS